MSVREIRVNQCCRVSFSIGKYKNEMYCDVKDMDACSLIFGMHWQYDVNAKHLSKYNL